jgi:hypothetical protein
MKLKECKTWDVIETTIGGMDHAIRLIVVNPTSEKYNIAHADGRMGFIHPDSDVERIGKMIFSAA